MAKYKLEAFAGICILAMGMVAGHAMSNPPVSGEPARVATSVAPYDMMIAARNLPVQVIDSLY